MSAHFTPDEKVLEIHRRLAHAYGDIRWRSSSDPLCELVRTILSQNTNDHNRDLAFERLRAQFPTWKAVRDAPAEKVIQAIRPAGLAPSKGPRIQKILQRLTEERGELSLEFLRELPLAEARAWLTGLNGVGPKTAAIVLLFSLDRPAFPVDTHIHRVTRRLGLIPPRTSREKAHALLAKIVPPELYYPFHIEIIEHGRRVCAARQPRCESCILRDLCNHYQGAKTYDQQSTQTISVVDLSNAGLPLAGPGLLADSRRRRAVVGLRAKKTTGDAR
ncbi:MAG: endonuclease III [Chloroflexi bacterium]|nr:MAG: endonuclease III [Chloroflexota bacterium]